MLESSAEMHAKNGTIELYRDYHGRPIDDLAFEGDLLERACSGSLSLLVYSWIEPVVVLGYGQPVEDVDLGWCSENGVPVLRRLTGGTGVVHCRDLAVSLVVPEDHHWARGIVQMYGRFLAALAAGLNRVGARVELKADPRRAGRQRSRICFEDQLAETLLVGGRKVVGCAQARRRGGVLIHAAISLNLRPELYAGAFRSNPETILTGLADAAPGVAASEVGDAVTREIFRSLADGSLVAGKVAPSAPMLDRYRDRRWMPIE